MKATVTGKGQITIPLPIRRKLKLHTGVVLELDESADHQKATKCVDVDRMRSVVGIARKEVAGKSVAEWTAGLRGPAEGRTRRARMKAPVLSAGFALVLLCTTAGSAVAACGIGSKLWEGNDSTGAQALALTTDVFTFKAISTTFEVAGCTAQNNIFKRASSEKVRHYASNNFDRLARDMARGDGEHLDAFASLLQLDEGDRAEFKAFSQKNLEHLFPRDNVTVEEFLAELSRRMAESVTLSRYLDR